MGDRLTLQQRKRIVDALLLIRVPKDAAARLRAELRRRESIWTPQPGPQTMAYNSTAYITGYGGAAGGGKSDLSIGLALTQHRRAIVFRREAEQTRDLFDRAKEIVGDKGRVNLTLKLISDLPGDRQVEFDGIKNIDDWRKHRGRPRDLMVFDEATEFEEIMIRSLMAWNRTTIEGQRTRIVLPFNPPGAKKGQWIIDFFGPWLNPKHPRPAEPGELRWYTTIDSVDYECSSGDPACYRDKDVFSRCDAAIVGGKCAECSGEVVYPLSRTFIPARLDDNAFLTRDPQYRATLMALPEPLRSQLLYGDFQAEESDEPWQIIPTRWVQLAQERWIERERPKAPLSALGSDVARGGIDRTTTAPRIGAWFGEIDAVPGKQTPDGAAVIERLRHVASLYGAHGGDRRVPVGMDTIGVGSAPLDFAREVGIEVFPINVAEAADEGATDRTGMLGFANRRAQLWWGLREALDPDKGEDLCLPPDRELLVDLTAPRYEVSLRGIKVEDKDHIRSRIGRSTDKGDAVINAWAARPFSVGYQSVSKRPAIAISKHFSPAFAKSKWKSQRGL